tara:strand:- start:294 stop:428 length:135 start_codon:yes stop_codon:yes gene_type:complete
MSIMNIQNIYSIGLFADISPKPTVVIVVTVKYRANKYLDDIESS